MLSARVRYPTRDLSDEDEFSWPRVVERSDLWSGASLTRVELLSWIEDQAAIQGAWRVDFVVLADVGGRTVGAIVECDGARHGSLAIRAADRRRDRISSALLPIVRITNAELRDCTNECWRRVVIALLSQVGAP